MLSFKFRIHLRKSCLVRIVNVKHSSKSIVSVQTKTVARYSLSVGSKVFFASLNVRDRYPVSRGVSFSCLGREKHPTCVSHASVYCVMCPL